MQDIIEWLESESGEAWSRETHQPINPAAYIDTSDNHLLAESWAREYAEANR